MRQMKLIIAALLTAAPIATMADTITLDFETGAPCAFVSTTPLTTLGNVSFAGVDGTGGSILNECGNFGQNARSGTDFYAFNTGAGSGTIVDLTFGGLIDSFSIWASQGRGTGTTFIAEAFDIASVLLDSFTLNPVNPDWGLLSLSASGINSVRLTFTGRCCGIYDDLTYTTSVPEPGTLALLGIGLFGMGLARRRKA